LHLLFNNDLALLLQKDNNQHVCLKGRGWRLSLKRPPHGARLEQAFPKQDCKAMTKQRILTVVFALALPLTCGAAYAADPTLGDILSALRPKPDALTDNARGIRAIAPISVDASTGHHKFMVMPAAQAAKGPSLDLNVVFRPGSADLTRQATTMLSMLGMALNSPSLAHYRFRIEGHTDTVGAPEQNMTLSKARAEKVVNFLEHDFGVLAVRLQPVGMGENGLLVLTPDQTDEPRNRRVHIVNLGG
jgi:OOP family OmpA-OmpF porin